MSTKKPEKTQENQPKRSPDFRYIPVDTIGLIMNENSAKLVFGIEEGPGKIIEEIGIFLTPKSLKLLGIIATKAIEATEKATGETVDIDDEKMKAIDDGMSIKSSS